MWLVESGGQKCCGVRQCTPASQLSVSLGLQHETYVELSVPLSRIKVGLNVFDFGFWDTQRKYSHIWMGIGTFQETCITLYFVNTISWDYCRADIIVLLVSNNLYREVAMVTSDDSADMYDRPHVNQCLTQQIFVQSSFSIVCSVVLHHMETVQLVHHMMLTTFRQWMEYDL